MCGVSQVVSAVGLVELYSTIFGERMKNRALRFFDDRLQVIFSTYSTVASIAGLLVSPLYLWNCHQYMQAWQLVVCFVVVVLLAVLAWIIMFNTIAWMNKNKKSYIGTDLINRRKAYQPSTQFRSTVYCHERPHNRQVESERARNGPQRSRQSPLFLPQKTDRLFRPPRQAQDTFVCCDAVLCSLQSQDKRPHLQACLQVRFAAALRLLREVESLPTCVPAVQSEHKPRAKHKAEQGAILY